MSSKHELGAVIRDGELADGRRNEPPPENPPPGPKWQAKAGLQRLRLNGAESATLWLLIDHANSKSGLCYPSQPTLASVLNIPEPTMRKAIASLNARGLIRSLERFDARGRTSNAYLINWAPLFAAYRDMRRKPKMDPTPRPKMDPTPRPKMDPKPMNVEPMDGEPMALNGAGFAGRRDETTNGRADLEGKKGSQEKDEKRLAYERAQVAKYCRRRELH